MINIFYPFESEFNLFKYCGTVHKYDTVQYYVPLRYRDFGGAQAEHVVPSPNYVTNLTEITLNKHKDKDPIESIKKQISEVVEDNNISPTYISIPRDDSVNIFTKFPKYFRI